MTILVIIFCVVMLWCGSVSARGLVGAIESAERPAQEAKQELIRSSEEQQAKGAKGLIEWSGDPAEVINTDGETAVEK